MTKPRQQCRYCDRPAKYVQRRVCGAHDMQMRRSGLTDEQFAAAIASGEQPGRKPHTCPECGTDFVGGKQITCSDRCATRRRRRSQRESKRREYLRDPEKVRSRARSLREKNPEVYRDQDRRRIARKQAQNRRFCEVCGTETTGTRTGRKYCCVDCRNLARKRRRQAGREAPAGVQAGLAAIALANVPAFAPLSAGGRAMRYQCRCVCCDALFRSVMGTAKYCSVQCRRAASSERQSERRQAVPDRNVVCDVCGTRFRTRIANRKYCRKRCATVAASAQRLAARAPPEEIFRDCDICGERFQADRKTGRLCSPNCRAEAKRREAANAAKRPGFTERQKLQARQRNHTTADCIICGRDMTDFDDLRKNRYTCSEECRRLARKAKQRRSYERRKRKHLRHSGTD